MTTFTPEEIEKIEVVKKHMAAEAKRKNLVLEIEITDKMALQYSLGVTIEFIKQVHQKDKQSEKNKFKTFLAKKK